jgi:hypothetical protein
MVSTGSLHATLVGEALQAMLDQLLGRLDVVARSVILEHDSLPVMPRRRRQGPSWKRKW